MEFEVDPRRRSPARALDARVHSAAHDASTTHDARNARLRVGRARGRVRAVMTTARAWVCAARRGERGGWTVGPRAVSRFVHFTASVYLRFARRLAGRYQSVRELLQARQRTPRSPSSNRSCTWLCVLDRARPTARRAPCRLRGQLKVGFSALTDGRSSAENAKKALSGFFIPGTSTLGSGAFFAFGSLASFFASGSFEHRSAHRCEAVLRSRAAESASLRSCAKSTLILSTKFSTDLSVNSRLSLSVRFSVSRSLTLRLLSPEVAFSRLRVASMSRL